jgi:hypothetical protein
VINLCIRLYEPYSENKENWPLFAKNYGTKEYDQEVISDFNRYTKANDKKILLATDVYRAVHKDYYIPLFNQMNKELKLNKIHKELEDLRY